MPRTHLQASVELALPSVSCEICKFGQLPCSYPAALKVARIVRD